MKYLVSVLKVLFILLFIAYPGGLYAQMSIGSGTKPAEAALLQLKDKESTPGTAGATATTGGLLLPRVELTALGTFLDASLSADKKKDHTGLLVYNVKVNPSLQLEKGIYQWNGTEWEMLKKITKKEGASIKKEIYQSGSPLDSRTVSLGIFEFRISSGWYPQLRLAPGHTNSQTYYWHINKYWALENVDGKNWAESGYSFKLMSASLNSTSPWTDCGTQMKDHERDEIWLADVPNASIYHVQFLTLFAGGLKTYVIIVQKY
ncbi:MAG: hypothetical protein LBS88_04515 [Tannerellaceae bacterium]|jgi:hypothetical protein|nr:hypothetical protein [Tannerellaceae bacterium]